MRKERERMRVSNETRRNRVNEMDKAKGYRFSREE